MKTKHKEAVRHFILQQILNSDDYRWRLHQLAEDHNMDPFEAIECFEHEVDRINKLFCYPGQ